jgi:hypothetical protein
MKRIYRLFMVSGTMMVLAVLAGCGPNVAIGGTGLPITVTNRSLTTSNDPAGAVRTGPVTLHSNAKDYGIRATIFVIVSNQSNHTIYFPDHLTNCTVILLQRLKVQPLAGDNVQAGINPCRLGIVTRIHSLGPGRRLVVRLVAPLNNWPSGFYHATLIYRTSLNAGPSTTINSAVFTVGLLGPLP